MTKMRPHAIVQLTPGPNNIQHKTSMIIGDTNRELKSQSELGMLMLKKQTKSEYTRNQQQPKESTIVEDNTAIDTHRRLLSQQAKKRWSKLTNVLKTITRLNREKTKRIDDPNEILTEIRNYASRSNLYGGSQIIRHIVQGVIMNDFEDKMRSEKFFRYISV